MDDQLRILPRNYSLSSVFCISSLSSLHLWASCSPHQPSHTGLCTIPVIVCRIPPSPQNLHTWATPLFSDTAYLSMFAFLLKRVPIARPAMKLKSSTGTCLLCNPSCSLSSFRIHQFSRSIPHARTHSLYFFPLLSLFRL